MGISCLASSTVDEDNVSLVKSPEKKALISPVQSISDIFAKSASSKVAKSRDVTVPERSVSPFAAKRGDEAVKKPPLAGKKLVPISQWARKFKKVQAKKIRVKSNTSVSRKKKFF